MLESVNRRAQRGLTLVELLVGLALGMVVVASGTMLLTTPLREHRSAVAKSRREFIFSLVLSGNRARRGRGGAADSD